MDLEKIANGEISVERFFGQTVIYLPTDIGNKVSKQSVESILLEYFTQERLNRFQWNYNKTEFRSIGFYWLEIPSVLIYKSETQPEYEIPDKIVQRIREECSK